MTIPTCIITGRIAGDSDACGDCDPCTAAHTIPDAVKHLLREKDEWRQKYSEAAGAKSFDEAFKELNLSPREREQLVWHLAALRARKTVEALLPGPNAEADMGFDPRDILRRRCPHP